MMLGPNLQFVRRTSETPGRQFERDTEVFRDLPGAIHKRAQVIPGFEILSANEPAVCLRLAAAGGEPLLLKRFRRSDLPNRGSGNNELHAIETKVPRSG